MDDTQTGLIYKNKVMKQLRQALQHRADRSGKWSKAKPAIDSVTLGERNDLVMVENSSRGLENLVIIQYREITGDQPKIRIAPRLAMRLFEREDDECPLWPAAVSEITARVGEFRSAVAASGEDTVEIVVVGKSDLRGKIIDSLTVMCRLLPGAPVLIDGQLVKGGLMDTFAEMSEFMDQGEPGVPDTVFQPEILLGWQGEWEIAEVYDDDPRKLLRFASGDAWKAGTEILFQNSLDRSEWVTSSHTKSRYLARNARDITELKNAVVAGGCSPALQSLLPQIYKKASEDRGLLIPIWKDADSLVGLVTGTKGADVKVARKDHWQIGVGFIPTVNIMQEEDYAAISYIAGTALKEQIKFDILSLATTALTQADTVVIDVGALGISGEVGAKAVILTPFVYEAVELARLALPIGASIGNVRIGESDGLDAQRLMSRPKKFAQ